MSCAHRETASGYPPSSEQRPLRGLALQQVRAQRHLAARDVRAQALAHATERQVPDGGQRCQVQLTVEVHVLLLGQTKPNVHPLRLGGGVLSRALAAAVVVAARVLTPSVIRIKRFEGSVRRFRVCFRDRRVGS